MIYKNIAKLYVDEKRLFVYNMFHMDTNRLRQFCVIAETGSLTKAAELLHITHSGLSKAMKLLQEELGQIILRPAGRGLTLTEDGRQLYQNAKKFLEIEHQLFHTTYKIQKQSLRIGTTESFLPTLCENIKTLLPYSNSITVLDLSPGQIEQMVANHELDYGITYTPFPMDSIDVIEVGKYQLGCYLLDGHFGNMEISEIPFAVPSAGIPTNPLGIKERDGWIESLAPRNRKYLVNLLSTAIELALQGLCAIYIPKYVATNINRKLSGKKKLIEKPVPNELKNPQRVFLITHTDKPRDEQFRQVKKIISLMIKS